MDYEQETEQEFYINIEKFNSELIKQFVNNILFYYRKNTKRKIN